MADINVAAGRRVAIIRRALSSVPMDYTFSVRAVTPGQFVSGTVEIRKSRWIIPGSPMTFPLQQNNVVSAGLWNTFMSVDVIPAVDVVITTHGRRMRNLRTILLLAVAVVAMAATIFFTYR